jgi:glutamyl-tRNA synthetase
MRELILRHALANAVEFGGKARAEAVLGKVLAEQPELKRDIVKVRAEVKSAVKRVNSWSLTKQKAELKRLGPPKKPPKVERIGLPALPGAVPGKVIMRLAPFPSGPLHIGNAKTAILNDEYCKMYKGRLLLVIDDTMGSPQKKIVPEAYRLIPEGLRWLGVKFEPKIIYKSDRLALYYNYAEQLLKLGAAYVCECSYHEVKRRRARAIACAHRAQSIKENLAKWRSMLAGKYAEGQAIVRFKTDMRHPNPAFRDRVLLRISEREHPRVKRKYKVWPLLDFSWAIDDHELGITHILRGKDLMMESEMEKAIWDIFGWTKPLIIHTGLMRIEGVRLSKSKSQLEIAKGIYTGWDDPRTWSLQSLARRGILPAAIRAFIAAAGVTEHDISVPIDNLYALNRRMIDPVADRYFWVGEPIEIVLDRLPLRSVKAPFYPGKRKCRKIPVSKRLYVDKLDFVAGRRKELRLMHFCNVLLNRRARVTGKRLKDIPKIHWVPAKSIKVRVIMPNGKAIDGLAEPEMAKVKLGQIVQLERIGFVRVDQTKPIVCYYAHR